MKCLIDGDMVVYQVAFMSQWKNEEGEEILLPFDVCIKNYENLIEEIKEDCWADYHEIFITGDKRLYSQVGLPENTPINFRETMTVSHPYKGNRNQSKPYHYDNLRVYISSLPECKLAQGFEADDLLSIEHRKDPDKTIICSRDKDLRMVEGKHYSWSCGRQLTKMPEDISFLGYLNRGKKVTGGGIKFFYWQMLTGDTVDNIKGIPGVGEVKAYNILKDLDTLELFHSAVVEVYTNTIKENWEEYFMEQADLLWMIRDVGEGGKLQHFDTWLRSKGLEL